MSWAAPLAALAALLLVLQRLPAARGASLDASVRATWPTSRASSLLLEASEFVADEDGASGALFWRFVDAALGAAPGASSDSPVLLPLTIAKPLLAPLTYDVLRIALAARAHSAAIETQRQLAAASAAAAGDANEAQRLLASHAWADVFPSASAAVRCAGASCDLAAAVTAAAAAVPGSRAQSLGEATQLVFSWDHVLPTSSPDVALATAASAPTVILYADLGAACSGDGGSGGSEVRRLLAQLRELSWRGACRGVLRHWFPAVNASSGADASTTFLSGYGVGLDVKSTEYKVLDDRAAPADAAAAGGGADLSASARAALSRFMSLDNTLGSVLGRDPLAALTAAGDAGSLGAGSGTNSSRSSSAGAVEAAEAAEAVSASSSVAHGVDWAALSARHKGKARELGRARARLNAAAAAGGGAGGGAAAAALLSDEKLNTWETGALGLQAAAYVLDAAAREARGEWGAAADPLEALVTAVSNFPSMAPYLSRLPVAPALQAEAEANARIVQPGASLMTVNGISVDPTAATFNIFSLFNVLRAEAHVVAQLDTLPLSAADRRRVQLLAVPGSSVSKAAAAAADAAEGGAGAGAVAAGGGEGDGDDGSGGGGGGGGGAAAPVIRVNTIVEADACIALSASAAAALGVPLAEGHALSGGASSDAGEGAGSLYNHSIVEFLNDVESDAAYSSWPSELRTLLQPTWQLHQLRRNTYTAVLVFDAAQPEALRALHLATQFVQMRAPVRFGVVLVPTLGAADAAGAEAEPSAAASGLHFALLHAMARFRHGPEAGREVLRAFASRWQDESARAAAAAAAAAAAEGGEGGGAEARDPRMGGPDVALTVAQAAECYVSAAQQASGSWTTAALAAEAAAALADKGGHLRRALDGVQAWVARTQLPVPGIALNGRPLPGLAIQGDMMHALQADMQLLQRLVHGGRDLDDSVAPSVYHALLGRATRLSTPQARAAKRAALAAPPTPAPAPGAPPPPPPLFGLPGSLVVPAWNGAVFAAESAQSFLPLSAPEAAPLIAHAAALAHAPGTADDVKAVTLTLMDDLGSPLGLRAAAALLSHVRAPPPAGAPAASCARSTRVAVVHVPTLLLAAAPAPAAAAEGAAQAARFRGPHVERPAPGRSLGDAVALACALASSRAPALVQVRADDAGPLLAGIVDAAQAALAARNGSSDLRLLGCVGCSGAAVADFRQRLGAWVASAAGQAAARPKSSARLLALLDAHLGRAAQATQLTPEQGAELAVVDALQAQLALAADVARRLAPAAAPLSRAVVSDAGGSSLSVRALAANGRILPIAAPLARDEAAGALACEPGYESTGSGGGDGAGAGAGAGDAPVSSSSLSACLSADDASILSLHERASRGRSVAALLQGATFPASAVDPDSLTADFMSAQVMAAASAVGASLSVQSGSAGGRAAARMELRSELLSSKHSAFTTISPRCRRRRAAAAAATAALAGAGDESEAGEADAAAAALAASAAAEEGEGDSESVGLFVNAIIDPASEDAQRYAPLLLMMRDRLGATVRVHLNPSRGHAELPVRSFFRYVLPAEVGLPVDLEAETGDAPGAAEDAGVASALARLWRPRAIFAWLPPSLILTLKLYVPEPWNTQATLAVRDTDNLKMSPLLTEVVPVEFTLRELLAAGQCMDVTRARPGSEAGATFPNGLQLQLLANGTALSDTLVMQNLGYYQLKAQPGVWSIALAAGRSADLYQVVQPAGGEGGAGASDGISGAQRGGGGLFMSGRAASASQAGALEATDAVSVVVRDFTGPIQQLSVRKKAGREAEPLLLTSAAAASAAAAKEAAAAGAAGGMLGAISHFFSGGGGGSGSGANRSGAALAPPLELHADGRETVHVFSLASGHVYERFLKIMMLAAVKRSPSVHLHFWLVENFLSPAFKEFAPELARALGADVSFVSYKWPNWLRAQSEKQRIIWGYKILFLDVLFPLHVRKIIYIDADQVVRADLAELWHHDLKGAVYGFTPFCTSRKETLGYQFWREGYWKDHLKDKPYHISALYVVDLAHFRRAATGDQLRAIYDTLSRDPNSLSNLDQDLPNYAQNQIEIHSLPQEWLWCESWCSDESKAASKTIDLCNNPRFKEPKLDMAKRVINGPLFPEAWVQLDHEVDVIEAAWRGTPPPPMPTPMPLRAMPTPTPDPHAAEAAAPSAPASESAAAATPTATATKVKAKPKAKAKPEL